ncbi:MAG: DegV family protein [Clostridia bacterium]|nr:DegV family protein [Clostridia bacterium]
MKYRFETFTVQIAKISRFIRKIKTEEVKEFNLKSPLSLTEKGKNIAENISKKIVKVLGKAMGSKKANNMLNTIVEQKGGIDFTKPFGVIYSGNDKTMINKYVEDSQHLWKDYVKEVPAYIIGSTIGTHVGPGAVGVAFFEKQ